VNIQPIQPSKPEWTHLCCKCGQWGATHADLDGEPYKAFYHWSCYEDLREEMHPSTRTY